MVSRGLVIESRPGVSNARRKPKFTVQSGGCAVMLQFYSEGEVFAAATASCMASTRSATRWAAAA